MQYSGAVTNYPVILRESEGGHVVIAPDFDNHQVSASEPQSGLDAMRDDIEDITWSLSFDNLPITLPSAPEALSSLLRVGDVLLLLPTLRRYSDLPKIVYLYKPFDKRLSSIFEEPYIWFSDPRKFNDPFELPDILDYSWTHAEAFAVVKNAYPLSRKKGGWGLQFNSSMEAFTHFQLNDPMMLEEIVREAVKAREEIAEKTRVACFSRTYDSFLMWSHYCHKHSGVAIGYDRQLIQAEEIIGGDVDYRWHPSKFRVGDFFREGDIFNFNNDYFARKQLTKHPDWSYEQEYRFVSLRHDGKHVIPREAIREVYIGCQAPAEARDTISGLVSSLGSNVMIYQMWLQDTWGLERRELNV